MKKDTFYFSHDYNAHNDVKILFMRQQLGMEGYGIYWFLIESLADAGGYLPMKIIPVLAMQMHVTEIKVKALIENFELFEIIDNQFFSIRLNKHLDTRKNLSELGKIGADKRWKNGKAIGEAISHPNAKERKGKEIKGKEINMIFNSENFLNEWNNWKEYKKHQHKFVFKTSDSEQKSLNNLYELSNQNESDAIKIINQSIANGWKGFFELKTLNNDARTKQQQKSDAIRDFVTRIG